MGQGAGGQESSSSTMPWKVQQPYLKEIYSRAKGLSGQPFEFYPGSTVAARDPRTLQAYDMAADRAFDPGSSVKAAEGMNRSVAEGAYLGGNPYRDQMYDQAADAVTRNYKRSVAGTQSSFAGAGRFGWGGRPSGLLSNAQSYGEYELGNTLNRLATSIYYDDYAKERGYQEAARRDMPAYSQAVYGELGMGREAGLAAEEYNQRTIQDLIARFEFGQNEEWQRLAQYSSLIGAPVMTSHSSSSPQLGKGWAIANNVVGMVGGLAGGLAGACHVAALFFGWFTPKWHAARRWLLEEWKGDEAEAFRSLYMRRSRELADELRGDPAELERVRPLFEWAAEMGALARA